MNKFIPALHTSALCLAIFLAAGSASRAQSFSQLPKPKNIIFMIADGAGFNHYQAAAWYKGTTPAFMGFPVRLAEAHYPAKSGEYLPGHPEESPFAAGYNPRQAWKDTAYVMQDYTESAASATALATGVKTYNNAIGMSPSFDTLVDVVQAAKATGRSAGVVTSVQFSHATPAGFVAHNVTRVNYSQIAREMLLRSRCDVIMGCGNPQYDEDGKPVSGKWEDACYVGDSALWAQLQAGSGRQVSFPSAGKATSVADIDGDGTPDPWTVITSLEAFTRLSKGDTPKRVLGCPQVYKTLQQDRAFQNGENNDSPPFVTPFNPGVPSLALMAQGALNVLDNNPSGFFLMIEGGATDWASHGNRKGRLLEEMLAFYQAVDSVIAWVNEHSSWDETLLVVTADHETGCLWNEQIFQPLTDNGAGHLPGMRFHFTDHTNSLVPFYAKGAGSELYRIFADEQDSVRGPFIQNSEVPQLLFFLWGKPGMEKE